MPIAGTIELSSDKLGVPSKNGSGFDDGRDGLESFSSELLADGSKLSPFFILEPDSACYFRPENPVFGDKILISEPKLLVDGAGDMSEQLLPRHVVSPKVAKVVK